MRSLVVLSSALVRNPETIPGINLSCLKCSQLFKLNPPTINADWRPVARAWRGEAD